MMVYAFDISEKYGIPVLIRIGTRLAHSRAGVEQNEAREQNEIRLPSEPKQFILLPANARRRYKLLLRNQALFEDASENSSFNTYIEGTDKSLGIITCGIAYNYLMENFPDRNIPYPILKIGQYPIPRNHMEKIYNSCDELLILEDGYPIVEELVKGFLETGKKIKGRLDGTLPRDGELTPNIVGKAIGREFKAGRPIPDIVKGRPPQLCKGCPHIYTYEALNDSLLEYTRGRVFSDIGCYTLGALEPFEAINTCVDMGASITMAKGAADAGFTPAVSVIGDSTFTHSGMTGLLDAVNDNSSITVFILDNATTAMTGGQQSSASGKIEDICMALGVEKDHLHVIDPLPKHHDANMEIFKKEIAYKGVSVIIPRRECIQTVARRLKMEKKIKEMKIKEP